MTNKMEDKIKLLETKLRLTTDILNTYKKLIWEIQRKATSCQQVMIHAKDGKSTEDDPIFKFTKEQVQILEDLIYTSKSDSLTSQNTSDFLKIIAREKEIKQEILDGL